MGASHKVVDLTGNQATVKGITRFAHGMHNDVSPAKGRRINQDNRHLTSLHNYKYECASR